jgi:hypothetical protein
MVGLVGSPLPMANLSSSTLYWHETLSNKTHNDELHFPGWHKIYWLAVLETSEPEPSCLVSEDIVRQHEASVQAFLEVTIYQKFIGNI